MTINEAILYIKHTPVLNPEYMDSNSMNEFKDMLIEALRRQEPQKPRIRTSLNPLTGMDLFGDYAKQIYECPCCTQQLAYAIQADMDVNYQIPYCFRCGQHILWEGKNEVKPLQ